MAGIPTVTSLIKLDANSSGQSVGYEVVAIDPPAPPPGGASYNDVLVQDHAVVTDPGGAPTDLSGLFGGSGWFLSAASAVDDRGWIVGRGALDGLTHDFLLLPGPDLVPVPEPSSMAILGLGGVLALGARTIGRRR